MEKWAKTLNQKKESAKNFTVVASYQEDLKSAVPEKKEIDVFEVPKAFVKETVEEKPSDTSSKEKLIALVAAYGGESDSEVEADAQDEGMKSYKSTPFL